jgi:hypothetical protein
MSSILIGYAPGDSPAREALYVRFSASTSATPCLVCRMDDHAHRPRLIHGIEGALIGHERAYAARAGCGLQLFRSGERRDSHTGGTQVIRDLARAQWGSRVFNPATVLITPKGQET